MQGTLVADSRLELQGSCVVDGEIRGANGLGDHVTGTVRIALPGAR